MDEQQKPTETPETPETPAAQPVVSTPEVAETSNSRPTRFSHEAFRVLLIIALIADALIAAVLVYLVVVAYTTGEMGGLAFLIAVLIGTFIGLPAAVITALLFAGFSKTGQPHRPIAIAPTQTIQPQTETRTEPPKTSQ